MLDKKGAVVVRSDGLSRCIRPRRVPPCSFLVYLLEL